MIFLVLTNFNTYLKLPKVLKRVFKFKDPENAQNITCEYKRTLILLSVLFSVWGVFMSFGSRTHKFDNDYARDFFKHYDKEITSSDSN